jgi:hypothetical protein
VRLGAVHRALSARFDLAVTQQFDARGSSLRPVKQDRRRCENRELTHQQGRGENGQAAA